jgi:hypothetical protein
MSLIYKSILNNLTGRLALSENNLELKIINNHKLDRFLHIEKADLLFKANTHSLIKTSGSYDSEFIKLINKDKKYNTKKGENFVVEPPNKKP